MLPADLFTWTNTLRSSVLVIVEDPCLAGYHSTPHQLVLGITLYRDSGSVCDGVCGVG